MAATVSDWSRVNAGSYVKSDGTKEFGNKVAHEYTVKLTSEAGEVEGPPFQWPVLGDFTVAVERLLDTGAIDTSGQAHTMTVRGSIDNVNWFDMATGFANCPGASAGSAFKVYDIDVNGMAPHFRISTDASGSSSDILRITVIPHHQI
tara:strand:- start:598 stop:1041 length:444 start_codon:yes stop_codon:yes gene_type:complete